MYLDTIALPKASDSCIYSINNISAINSDENFNNKNININNNNYIIIINS